MGDDDLVTAAQAAADVGRPVGTVRAWGCVGKLRAAVDGYRGKRYRLGDVRAVAKEYDARPGTAKIRAGRDTDREPTEAEVEAMVAEQMQCLPDWWWEEEARKLQRRAEGATNG